MAKQSNYISCAYGSSFTAMQAWYVSKGLISDGALYVKRIGQYFRLYLLIKKVSFFDEIFLSVGYIQQLYLYTTKPCGVKANGRVYDQSKKVF